MTGAQASRLHSGELKKQPGRLRSSPATGTADQTTPAALSSSRSLHRRYRIGRRLRQAPITGKVVSHDRTAQGCQTTAIMTGAQASRLPSGELKKQPGRLRSSPATGTADQTTPAALSSSRSLHRRYRIGGRLRRLRPPEKSLVMTAPRRGARRQRS
jgi:hypothetical protein